MRERDEWGSEEWCHRNLWLNFEFHLRDATDYLRQMIDVRNLPSVAIDGPDFAKTLPAIPAVYFVCRPPERKPIYIGRTINLRQRWTRDLGKNPAYLETEHHKLQAALKLRNAYLLWLKVPPDHLGIVEMMLIQMHKPKWNIVRR
jgi:hypothetical protein